MSYGQPSGYGYGYGPPQHPHGHFGYGPGPGMPMRPTPHPNATTALALGLMGVFCLGAFLGVPAIIVGRGVVRSISNEPHRAWTGEGTAKTAIVLGWVSVFETALFVASAVTSPKGSPAAATSRTSMPGRCWSSLPTSTSTTSASSLEGGEGQRECPAQT